VLRAPPRTGCRRELHVPPRAPESILGPPAVKENTWAEPMENLSAFTPCAAHQRSRARERTPHAEEPRREEVRSPDRRGYLPTVTALARKHANRPCATGSGAMPSSMFALVSNQHLAHVCGVVSASPKACARSRARARAPSQGAKPCTPHPQSSPREPRRPAGRPVRPLPRTSAPSWPAFGPSFTACASASRRKGLAYAMKLPLAACLAARPAPAAPPSPTTSKAPVAALEPAAASSSSAYTLARPMPKASVRSSSSRLPTCSAPARPRLARSPAAATLWSAPRPRKPRRSRRRGVSEAACSRTGPLALRRRPRARGAASSPLPASTSTPSSPRPDYCRPASRESPLGRPRRQAPGGS